MERSFVHGRTLLEGDLPPKKGGEGRNSLAMKSTLGSHKAGHGMNLPEYAFDWEDGRAILTGRFASSNSSYRRMSLGENDLKDNKEFNKRYNDLCGEVKVYNIKDLEQI